MQRLAAVLRQCVAELLPDRTKGDAVDDGTVTGFEAEAQMRLADFISIDELMRRQRDHRLRIAAAERTGAIEGRGKFRRHRARRYGAVDHQLVLVPRISDVFSERAFH